MHSVIEGVRKDEVRKYGTVYKKFDEKGSF